MGGMRPVPPGTYRKRGDEHRPPRTWLHYYRDPDAAEPVLLGYSMRAERHLEHRWFPADPGVYPKKLRGFSVGVQWLLDLYRSSRDRNEAVTVAETEEIRDVR